jgi:hypothetical protein
MCFSHEPIDRFRYIRTVRHHLNRHITAFAIVCIGVDGGQADLSGAKLFAFEAPTTSGEFISHPLDLWPAVDLDFPLSTSRPKILCERSHLNPTSNHRITQPIGMPQSTPHAQKTHHSNFETRKYSVSRFMFLLFAFYTAGVRGWRYSRYENFHPAQKGRGDPL